MTWIIHFNHTKWNASTATSQGKMGMKSDFTLHSSSEASYLCLMWAVYRKRDGWINGWMQRVIRAPHGTKWGTEFRENNPFTTLIGSASFIELCCPPTGLRGTAAQVWKHPGSGYSWMLNKTTLAVLEQLIPIDFSVSMKGKKGNHKELPHI